jgi:hypothetical protein
MSFGQPMAQGNESVDAEPRTLTGRGRSGATVSEPETQARLGGLLAASGFAALAAVVLAASIIFGLPGAEHPTGRGQVTGRVNLAPPPLRR